MSQLLREHYVAGNEDRIKLLLSGDNPNRINRDLQMMAYVSQAQARLLDSLRANLAEVEANRDKVENAQLELQEIAAEHGLEAHLSMLFRWKPEIDARAWKAAQRCGALAGPEAAREQPV